MKLVSKEILKKEYYQNYPHILTKKLIYFNAKAGSLANYYQTSFAFNNNVAPHLHLNKIMTMSKDVLYKGKGIIISKKKKNITFIENHRGFFFQKNILLDSPSFLGTSSNLGFSKYISFKNNIKHLIKNNTRFIIKIKKIKS